MFVLAFIALSNISVMIFICTCYIFALFATTLQAIYGHAISDLLAKARSRPQEYLINARKHCHLNSWIEALQKEEIWVKEP